MRQRGRLLAGAGVAVDLAFVVLDALTPGWNLPVTVLLIAPLLPALGGWLLATVGVSVLTVILAVVVGATHGRFGQFDEVVRIASIALVCWLAVIGTRVRARVDTLVQALDALPDAVTIQGPEGNVLYGNRAAAGLGGGRDTLARTAEQTELTDGDSGAPLDPERLPARRLLAGRTAEPVVIRSRDRATNAITWRRVQASPLHDHEGRVRSAVNVIEDITEMKAAEQRAAFLAEAATVLGSSLDTSATLESTARLVVPALADWCSIDLLDPRGRAELVVVAHADPEQVERARAMRRLRPQGILESGGLSAVLRSGERVLEADVGAGLSPGAAADPELQELLRGMALRSTLIVPLMIGPRIIGALGWATGESGRHLGPADLETAAQLATHVAVAVENARIHSARVEIATVLQDALLPTALPEVPGWALAAHYRAAGEANEVGGDFYDLVELMDGTLVGLVGDVAGKGAAAAALTARTRHTLVTAATLDRGDPRAGLALLNAALQAEATLELCSVAVVVVRGDVMTVLSAGHPLPLVLRGGELHEVGDTSPMLGAAPVEEDWRQVSFDLLPGDLVVLHTDGITDAVGRRHQRFGDARLQAALLDGPPGAQEAIDRLVDAVDAFERGPQADDRALLALHWSP